jgi:hypothetical protein
MTLIRRSPIGLRIGTWALTSDWINSTIPNPGLRRSTIWLSSLGSCTVKLAESSHCSCAFGPGLGSKKSCFRSVPPQSISTGFRRQSAAWQCIEQPARQVNAIVRRQGAIMNVTHFETYLHALDVCADPQGVLGEEWVLHPPNPDYGYESTPRNALTFGRMGNRGSAMAKSSNMSSNITSRHFDIRLASE